MRYNETSSAPHMLAPAKFIRLSMLCQAHTFLGACSQPCVGALPARCMQVPPAPMTPSGTANEEHIGFQLSGERLALGVEMVGNRNFFLIPAKAPLPARGRQVRQRDVIAAAASLPGLLIKTFSPRTNKRVARKCLHGGLASFSMLFDGYKPRSFPRATRRSLQR